MLFCKWIFLFICIPLVSMEFNTSEVLRKYKKEMKFTEQEIKEKLIEERSINQEALHKTILNLKETNNSLNNLLGGQTENEFKEYTLDKIKLEKFEEIKNKQTLYQELKHDLKKEIENINQVIKTMPEHIKTAQYYLLVKGIFPVMDVEKHTMKKREFYKDYIQEASGQTNMSILYGDIVKIFLGRSWDRIMRIIPIIEKTNEKVIGISRNSEYYDRWQLAHILQIPFTLKPFTHIEEKPTIWNKIKNWFGRYKRPPNQPSITKHQTWNTLNQWTTEAKERAQRGLEKKAESYYKWKQQEKEAGLLPPPGWD